MLEFPAMGLEFNIDPVALQFGDIKIFWYGIIIAFAFMLVTFLAMRKSKDFGIDSENVIDLILIAAPVAIVCARLYYVIFQWDNYRDSPEEIIKIWHGGIAIYGAVLGGMLAAWVFARYKKINTLNLFDLCAPYLLLAQGIGRWGNFINQEAFGTNTTLPWGMTSPAIKEELVRIQSNGINIDPNMPVHPTFLYESIWNIAAFFILVYFSKHRKKEGEVFFLYMILYGFGRFWIEGLRTDSLMLGNMRISQVLAAVFVIAFGILLFLMRKRALDGQGKEEPVIGASEYGDVLNRLNEEENSTENKAD